MYGQAQWPTNGKHDETTMCMVRHNDQLTASATRPQCIWSGRMANQRQARRNHNVYGQAQWPTNGKHDETTMYMVRHNGQLTACTTKPQCIWSGTMANQRQARRNHNLYGQAQWPTNGKRDETTMCMVRHNGQLTASATIPQCKWSGTMAN